MLEYFFSEIKTKSPFCAVIYRPPAAMHTHDYFEFAFPVKGECVNVINKREYRFGQTVCAILRPGDFHCFKNVNIKNFGDYRHLDIYVTAEKMKKICDFLSFGLFDKINDGKEPLIFNLPLDMQSAAAKKTEIIIDKQLKSPDESETQHTVLVTMLLSCLLEKDGSFAKQSAIPEWINRLIQKTASIEYCLKPASEISKDIGYAPEHVSREFHKYTGMTLKDFLTRKKMEYAANVLTANNVKIIDLALMLGYHNASNFSKNFYETFKLTPVRYRNQFYKKNSFSE